MIKNIVDRRYPTEQDYAKGMNNPETWFNGDNKWYGFLVIGTILNITAIPLLLLVRVKFFGLRIQFNKSSVTISKLVTMPKIISHTQAACIYDDENLPNYLENEKQLWDHLSFTLVTVMMWCAGHKLFKFLYRLYENISINNVSKIQMSI